ncbi:integrase [Pseudoprevotella muciniphila]|uniref:Integrase n=1 Tax=Pseudoprevotella muciniphila TaxID=2133944 RepID=A0A5P8E9R7_9BACT|nr:site-specific tyrosine recombinase/integron integrase [Pseudoprevotella muciniphila]QFQ13751.1 integrase [Pseudoprevotella muciniphila]
MKENIINTVVCAMQRSLDCRQIKLLKETLRQTLNQVEVQPLKNSTQTENENEQLLDIFLSAKQIEGCSCKTLNYYANTIVSFLATLKCGIAQVDTDCIRNYLSSYEQRQQVSKVTIDNMRRILSTFFAWLEDEDYIGKSPVRRIRKIKTNQVVKETLSDEDLERLRDSCIEQRDLALVDFLVSTGVRVGELVLLNRTDIDFKERQCVVFGKGNKERIVYFNARTKIHLEDYLNKRKDNNKALFVSLHAPYNRLTISGVEKRLKRLGKQARIRKIHPHKFRRTLATFAIDKGMPIEQVQRLLGHVKIDTTLQYAMVNQANVKIAHRKYIG